MKRVNIHPERGRWVPEVEGKWLANLHSSFRVGLDRYEAPIRPEDWGTKRLGELERALKENEPVVVRKDKGPDDLSRDGYIGVFRFKDLIFDAEQGLKLTFVARYA